MFKIAHLGIDYDEGDQSTYRKVKLKIGQTEYKFDTGDPVIDFKAASDKALELTRKRKIDIVMCSSSLDHFTMDGKKYRWTIIDNQELLERAV